ncbi:GTP cyclohydrolase I [Micrococcus cohnii]|uniref:GTP cyclohydrolase 1 n=2 Tax=Micrococcus cohnii TaxID=993416 RepID=A0A7W7GQC7_9MICC|nr:GTP cyclohydrolase I [Micrococcus cohnii]
MTPRTDGAGADWPEDWINGGAAARQMPAPQGQPVTEDSTPEAQPSPQDQPVPLDTGALTAVTGVPGTFDPASTAVDRPRIEAAVREILEAIGEDPEREGLHETPKRVAKAYAEFFAGLHQRPEQVLGTTFDIAHEELVLVKDIPFYSTCEHHLVPFHGTAHIGYIPGEEGRVTGLSKLARLVELYARRPQVQERLTTQIVEALVEHLAPRGAIVVVQAEHMCMSMRGVRKPGAKTVTSAVRGQLRDPSTRSEAMSLILNG